MSENCGAKEEKQDTELFLFKSALTSLSDLHETYKNLTKLSVIEQPLSSINGIENLCTLTELWIVNCQLQDISELAECTLLEKLYLYSNKIEIIPDFSNLTNLKVMWLCRNKISSLEGIDCLTNLQKLHICENDIKEITQVFTTNSTLHELNLSGNPIRNLKDIRNLMRFKSLKWLSFSDAIYKPTPITILANYRSYVVYSLPHLQVFDDILITAEERNGIIAFYKKKLLFYSMRYHSCLADILTKRSYDLMNSYRELEKIKSGFYEYKVAEHKAALSGKEDDIRIFHSKFVFLQSEMTRWKLKHKHYHTVNELLAQIKHSQLQIELEYAGNIQFMEPSQYHEFLKSLLTSFVCQHTVARVSLESIILDQVTQIYCNNEMTLKEKCFFDFIAEGVNDNFFILCDPFPISHMSDWPTSYIKHFFFKDIYTNQSVTKCISLADKDLKNPVAVQRNLLLNKSCLTLPKFGIVVGVFNMADVSQSPPIKSDISTHECCVHKIEPAQAAVPLFILQFHYMFQDLLSSISFGVDPKCIRPGSELKSTTDWSTLTSLSLKAQNISTLGIGDTVVLRNVSSLDISYNQVKDISLIGHLFPNLVSLDISFNNISSLSTLQVAECMETIDLKWNLLNNFLDSIFILKSRIPKLKNLDLMHNPFMDIHKENDFHYFMCKYFPDLDNFNGEILQLNARNFILKESDCYPLLTYRKMFADNSLSVAWKSDILYCNTGPLHKYLCKDEDDSLICVSLEEEKMSSFDSELSLKNLKWLNLSKNVLSDITFARKMPLLEEVNLCYNVLEIFHFTPPITNKTVKIDLSCNYLTTLKDFQSTSFPCLKILNVSKNKLTSIQGTGGLINLCEFYASHNNIRDLDGLYPAKQWRKIKTVDFSYNPVENNSSFRQLCIFQMPSLVFFNGQGVQTNELIGATKVYGVYLNQDYLFKIYTRAELANITELTLSQCSISKISLDPNSVQNVKSLSLSHNKITDLHWLSAFPKLVTVCLSYNEVSSFSNSYISDTDSNLEVLHLDNNKITSLLPLKLYTFKNLKTIFLQNNNIRNIDNAFSNAWTYQMMPLEVPGFTTRLQHLISSEISCVVYHLVYCCAVIVKVKFRGLAEITALHKMDWLSEKDIEAYLENMPPSDSDLSSLQSDDDESGEDIAYNNLEYQMEHYQQYLEQKMGSEADEVMKSDYPIQNSSSRFSNSSSPAEEHNISDTNHVINCDTPSTSQAASSTEHSDSINNKGNKQSSLNTCQIHGILSTSQTSSNTENSNSNKNNKINKQSALNIHERKCYVQTGSQTLAPVQPSKKQKPDKGLPKEWPELWFAGKENKFSGKPPEFLGHSEIHLKGDSPFEFFIQLFPESIFELTAFESNRYAFKKGKENYKVSVPELKVYIGINIIMTYIKYFTSRMYWSSIQGLRMDLIADSMAVNRFEEIKRYLHFANNEEPDQNDKFWKIRSVVDVLNRTFKNYVSAEEHQSIDEMLVPFKGRSILKQYLKMKPKKWGFKIWVRASSTGYVSSFELYQGAQVRGQRSVYGPIGDTVLRLCSDIHGKNHKVFMDNLFTGLSLLRQMREFNMFVVGTLRTNRIPKNIMAKLSDSKLLSRGNCSIITSSDDISIVKWMDNNPVYTISTYAGALPEDEVSRYDRSKKQRITITRPYSIQQYNMFMGGVDLMDRMVAHYPHGFKNKKWYLRVFFHFVNMALVNAWILYKKKNNKPDMPLLTFKASVATSLINVGVAKNKRPGRPSLDEEPKKKRTASSKVALEVRYDGTGHYPTKVNTMQAPRCHSNTCRSCTRFICKKCQEPVCPDCMENFHTKASRIK